MPPTPSGVTGPNPITVTSTTANPMAVTSASNGMAVAALVLGILGLLTGLVPILALFAVAMGILAVVFGFAGRRKVKRGQTASGSGMATAGLILGVLAVLLGFVGFSIVNDAFTDLGNELEEISDDFANFGTELIPQMDLIIESCTSDGAVGTVANNHSAAVDISIEVQYFDDAGTLLDTSVDFVSNLGRGQRAAWDTFYFGDVPARCQVGLSSVWES